MSHILYNSPRMRGAPYPYGVLAAGHSRVTPRDAATTAQFNEHTLILTIGGAGDIVAEGQTIRTKPLTLSWVNTWSDYSHGCASGSKDWTYLWFSFEGFAVGKFYGQVLRRNHLNLLVKPDTHNLFDLVLGEVSSNSLGKYAQLSSLVGRTLALFESSPRQQDEPHEDLQRMIRALSDNLADRWDNKTMAAAAGLSVSRFHAVFRDKFGISPARWVRQQRFNEAKRLLTETDIAIANIGELCGYPDPHHFSREFSKSVMLSPSKFRRLMRPRVAR